MKSGARYLLIIVGTLVGVVLLGAVLDRFLHPKLPPMNFDRVFTAAQAYRRNLEARRQPLPARVSLAELTNRGFLRAADVPGLAGLEVAAALQFDETRPQDVLARVRLPGGDELVALACAEERHAGTLLWHLILPMPA
jgi:hypothetical protein